MQAESFGKKQDTKTSIPVMSLGLWKETQDFDSHRALHWELDSLKMFRVSWRPTDTDNLE
jgi:hypothetical protein